LRPSNDSTIRVLLADPQSMFLSGLGRLLDRAGLAVVALARDEETAVAFAAEHEPDVIVVDVRPPAMSGGETVRGLLPREHESVRSLFAGIRVAPLGGAEGWQAGEWRRDFAARGHTLTQADCLIAAAALGLGGRLATGNPRDFPMSEVAVEHWPVGS